MGYFGDAGTGFLGSHPQFLLVRAAEAAVGEEVPRFAPWEGLHIRYSPG